VILTLDEVRVQGATGRQAMLRWSVRF
jgi:hypothetical protein